MTSNELRDKFLNFFESKGHKRLPSASLVPKDDSSVLFTSAGMQQFRKFYAAPKEAPATTITTCQKCIRTSDIDEVGDSTHLTFFEMLGNFSFGYPESEGSYFKKEAIEYAWEFLTKILGVEKSRITATYFKGEDDIPADDESLSILKDVTGLVDDKIKGTGKDETFWSLGTENSPGGPTVEFYIDGVEIWNLVFNQYTMQGGKYIPSKYQGVDTGMGLERLACMMQGKDDVFETDLFASIISEIERISGKKYQKNEKAFRVIADHYRAAIAIISEAVEPSNKERGYVVRRLLRKSLAYLYLLAGHNYDNGFKKLFDVAFSTIGDISSENKYNILHILMAEEAKFFKALSRGIDNFPMKMENGYDQFFDLYQSNGLYPDIIFGIMEQKGYEPTESDKRKYLDEFNVRLEKHKELSRTASAGMFRGGLADAGEQTTKLHTAAHLMLAAMRKVLGPDVNQKGSNITAERLRFDFNYPEKLTESQIKEIEDIVNSNIAADLPVTMEELNIEDAKKSGATGVFDDRYGDKVKVYTIGEGDNIVSREICGGPHVERTGQLGHFKITKEESSSAGIRRVKAILE